MNKKSKDQLFAEILSLIWSIDDEAEWIYIQNYIRPSAVFRSKSNDSYNAAAPKLEKKIKKLYREYEYLLNEY